MGYATVEDLKTRLETDGVATLPSDPVCEALLAAAELAINAHCKRDFNDHPLATVVTEGQGADNLLLPVYPVRTIFSATVDGVALTAAELAEIRVTSYGRVYGRTWDDGSVIEFCLDYGYTETPAQVKSAALTLASRAQRHGKVRERINEGVKSESIEGYRIDLDPIEMDRDVAKVLTDYVKKRGAR